MLIPVPAMLSQWDYLDSQAYVSFVDLVMDRINAMLWGWPFPTSPNSEPRLHELVFDHIRNYLMSKRDPPGIVHQLADMAIPKEQAQSLHAGSSTVTLDKSLRFLFDKRDDFLRLSPLLFLCWFAGNNRCSPDRSAQLVDWWNRSTLQS